MDATRGAQTLYDLWAEIADLSACEELLGWDQETYMPRAGSEGRGRLLATLAGIKHERLTAPELASALDACRELAEQPGADPVLALQVREAERHACRARNVPNSLARELALASSQALAAWHQAREEESFGRFAPSLARLVALKRDEAAAIAPHRPPYDVLLDDYEPGTTAAELEPLFADLASRLTELVRAVAASDREVDEEPLRAHYPAERQRRLGRFLAERIGFDFARGRLDETVHPFCAGLNRDDVRLTWHADENDFRPALFGVLHEAGHGLYEQGLPAAWSRTPLGVAASFGVHESQSRLWENHVGRSKPFWRGLLPHLQELLPRAAALDLDTLWPTLHTVRPSPIRVLADETTYNLHIVIRFELEQALVSGELEVSGLESAWNDAYEERLGLRPESPRAGVLQDIHWASGLFGYFPTYTLGTLMAAQLFAAAEAELGGLDPALEAGELAPLLAWLREKVHCHGCRHPPRELVLRATGAQPSADPFLAHVTRHAEEVYQL